MNAQELLEKAWVEGYLAGRRSAYLGPRYGSLQYRDTLNENPYRKADYL